MLCGAVVPALAADDTVAINIHLPGGVANYSAPASASQTVEHAMQHATNTNGGAALSYTATYFQSQSGYAAMAISSHPPIITGNFGTYYWLLCVNGQPAGNGMSSQQVTSTDIVDWYYTATFACSD